MFSITEFSDNVKLIRDPIYGFIEIPEEILPVIDHKLVQRLPSIHVLSIQLAQCILLCKQQSLYLEMKFREKE
jgi:hypothetical protein